MPDMLTVAIITFIVFLILKKNSDKDEATDLPWIWVFSPLWIYLSILITYILTVLTLELMYMLYV